MDKKVIAKSDKTVGGLDNNYTLYDDGTVVHYYDTHHIGGNGYKKSSESKGSLLSDTVKHRLLSATKDPYVTLAKQLLELK